MHVAAEIDEQRAARREASLVEPKESFLPAIASGFVCSFVTLLAAESPGRSRDGVWQQAIPQQRPSFVPQQQTVLGRELRLAALAAVEGATGAASRLASNTESSNDFRRVPANMALS